MLARRDLGQAVLEPPCLHLEEGDERAHLLLDRLEPDERVELGLELGERPGLRPGAERVGEDRLHVRAGRAPKLLSHDPSRRRECRRAGSRGHGSAGPGGQASSRSSPFRRATTRGATGSAR